MPRLHPSAVLNLVLLLSVPLAGCHHLARRHNGAALGASSQNTQEHDSRSRAINGIVIDAEDHPVSGALVHLSTTPPQEATTDASGRFHLDDVACTAETAFITASHAELKNTVVASCGDFAAIRIAPGHCRIFYVKDAITGEGVAGAEVAILQEHTAPVLTDASGRAALKQYDTFFASFLIKANGYADKLTAAGSNSRASEMTVLLQRGTAASGRVTNKQGEGVAGATVFIEIDATNAPATPDAPKVSITDASGFWRHDNLPRGLYQFWVQDPRIGHASTPPIRMTGNEPLMGLTLVGDAQPVQATALVAGQGAEPQAPSQAREVHGHVVNTDGAAVPGARVYLHVGEASDTDDALCDFGETQMTADAQGRFVFTDVPQQSAYVWAAPPDTSLLTCPRLQDVVSTTTHTGDIQTVVPDGGTIKGRIVFAQGGSPLAFDLLQDGAFKFFQRSFSQQPNGVFVIETFSPGAGDFDVVGPDFVTTQVACTVPSGGTVDVGVISVERGLSLSGHVTSSDNTPVAYAEVLPASRAVHPPYSTFAMLERRISWTDVHGHYMLSGMEAADVQAFHPIWGIAPSGNAADGNSILTLQPAGSICGVARRPGGFSVFKPLRLRGTDKAILTLTHPTSHGLYCFESLPAGVYCFEDQADKARCRARAPGAPIECPLEDGDLSEDAVCVQVHAGEDVRLDLNFGASHKTDPSESAEDE